MRDHSIRFCWITIFLSLIIQIVALNAVLFLPDRFVTVILSNLPVTILVFLLVALAALIVPLRDRIQRTMKDRIRAVRLIAATVALFIGAAVALAIQHFEPQAPSDLQPLLLLLRFGAFLMPWVLVGPVVSEGRSIGSPTFRRNLRKLGMLFLAISVVVGILYVFMASSGSVPHAWRVVVPADIFLLFTTLVTYRQYRFSTRTNVERRDRPV